MTDVNELKVQHYRQRVAELSVEYEERIANLRVEFTQLDAEVQELRQRIAQLESPAPQDVQEEVHTITDLSDSEA